MSLNAPRDPATAAPAAPARSRRPGLTLRPARPRDLESIRALAERAGIVCEELELARLVHGDPETRLVLCATAVIDHVETVLGLGVIELGHSATMPSLLLVDTALTAGLQAVLAEALIAQAREIAGRLPA